MNKIIRELADKVTIKHLKRAADEESEESNALAMEALGKRIELEKLDNEHRNRLKDVVVTSIGVGVPLLTAIVTILLKSNRQKDYATHLYNLENGDDGVMFTGTAASNLRDMNFDKK